jgi:hypothetical protein
MPLVVPGLMSSGKDKESDWQNKLMGKKIGDTSDEMVCPPTMLHLPNTIDKVLTTSEDLCKERSTRETQSH